MEEIYIFHSVAAHIQDISDFNLSESLNNTNYRAAELHLSAYVPSYDNESGLMIVELDPPIYASSVYIARNATMIVQEIYIFACKPPSKSMKCPVTLSFHSYWCICDCHSKLFSSVGGHMKSFWSGYRNELMLF